jgi:hypothetical protein
LAGSSAFLLAPPSYAFLRIPAKVLDKEKMGKFKKAEQQPLTRRLLQMTEK